jgi:hypothetical protein
MIICPVCGKHLTPETNDEKCSGNLYKHGKHPIFVFDFPTGAYDFRPETVARVLPKTSKNQRKH